jgi:uncharacterized coiled-coil DUF342 family protein
MNTELKTTKFQLQSREKELFIVKQENKGLKDGQSSLQKQISEQQKEIVKLGNEATGWYDQLRTMTGERDSLVRERAAADERQRVLKEKYEDTVKELRKEIGAWKWKFEEGQKDNLDLREYINGLSRPREGNFAEDHYVKLFDGLIIRYESPHPAEEKQSLLSLYE